MRPPVSVYPVGNGILVVRVDDAGCGRFQFGDRVRDGVRLVGDVEHRRVVRTIAEDDEPVDVKRGHETLNCASLRSLGAVKLEPVEARG